MNVDINSKMYRRIIEAVPEGIWVVDPQGRTIFSNRRMAEMLGTDFESMSEQSCFGWVFPEELDDAHRQFARNVAGDTRPFDFRLRRADGSPIWVSISSMPVQDEAGAMFGLLGLFSDITGRRRTEAALRESETSPVLSGRRQSLSLSAIVSGLRLRVQQIEATIVALESLNTPDISQAGLLERLNAKKRRGRTSMPPEERQQVSTRMKGYWAKRRKKAE